MKPYFSEYCRFFEVSADQRAIFKDKDSKNINELLHITLTEYHIKIQNLAANCGVNTHTYPNDAQKGFVQHSNSIQIVFEISVSQIKLPGTKHFVASEGYTY